MRRRSRLVHRALVVAVLPPSAARVRRRRRRRRRRDRHRDRRRVTVDAEDMKFDVDEIDTAPGALEVTLVQKGSLDHTFVVEDADGDDGRRQARGEHGQEEDSGTYELEPGDYEYFCDVPGHRGQGMEGSSSSSDVDSSRCRPARTTRSPMARPALRPRRPAPALGRVDRRVRPAHEAAGHRAAAGHRGAADVPRRGRAARRWWLMLAVVAGGAMAAGGANTINCWIERDRDQLMRRTHGRPLPRGEIDPARALVFGIVLNVLAFVLLADGREPARRGAHALGDALLRVRVHDLAEAAHRAEHRDRRRRRRGPGARRLGGGARRPRGARVDPVRGRVRRGRPRTSGRSR